MKSQTKRGRHGEKSTKDGEVAHKQGCRQKCEALIHTKTYIWFTANKFMEIYIWFGSENEHIRFTAVQNCIAPMFFFLSLYLTLFLYP